MEVRNANVLLNRVTTAIENSYADEHEKQEAKRRRASGADESAESEEQSVKLSISAAGMKRSRLLTHSDEGEDEFSGRAELESMIRQMDGLSSQIINGYFSISDRLNFNTEIQKLTTELNRLNGDADTVTKEDCIRLSGKISDLTKIVSDAAVYRQSARNMFMVNSKQPARVMQTRLDIAI